MSPAQSSEISELNEMNGINEINVINEINGNGVNHDEHDKRNRFTIKLNSYGDPLPVYKFVRLPPPVHKMVLHFEVDAGYVSSNSEVMIKVTLPCGETKEVICEGNVGFVRHGQFVLEPVSGTYAFQLGAHKGYIQVPPVMQINSSKSISPDGICLQTLVSKWMGPVDRWDIYLRDASADGFNMIHFTPLQERGHSNSPYSILDHHLISSDLFSTDYDDNDDDDNRKSLDKRERLNRLSRKIGWMQSELGLLSMIDVVWNHASCDSDWLIEHPEAGYTLENSPHLQKAFDLDEGIIHFSSILQSEFGLDPLIKNEADMEVIMDTFINNYLPRLKLWEYFVVNVEESIVKLQHSVVSLDELNVIRKDGDYSRHCHKIRIKTTHTSHHDSKGHPGEVEIRALLDQINLPLYKEYDNIVALIRQNIANRVRYERLDENGPRLGAITTKCPLVSTYFTRRVKVDGTTIAFANNGWIWNADPLVNFAEPTSDAYFTREVIIWGDCVKLRYGKDPDDSPWLWSYMREYTESMASIFHGFRIDNCHSTPIHVAEYLLNAARRVRPNLYVAAELFTGSEERDMLFVTRLGINSLIREAMVAWDPSDLGRSIAKFGGSPPCLALSRPEDTQSRAWPSLISYSRVHALLMDCTHDNEPPAQKRTVFDTLPNSALVAMSHSAIGSIRGYDQCIPKHLNIVQERRLYASSPPHGLSTVRKILLDLHQEMQMKGMSSISISQDRDVLFVERSNLVTGKSILLIARTAFTQQQETNFYAPLIVEKVKESAVVLSARLISRGDDPMSFNDHHQPILPMECEYRTDGIIPSMGSVERKASQVMVHLHDFVPGSVLAIRFVKECSSPDVDMDMNADFAFDSQINQAIKYCLKDLSWSDLNVVLYRSSGEENDTPTPVGTYDLPGYGPLPYSGIAGFMTVVEDLARNPYVDHPLLVNLRNGSWAIDYCLNRLKGRDSLALDALHSALIPIAQMVYMADPMTRARLFITFITCLYGALTKEAIYRMPQSIQQAGPMVQMLALTSLQLIGKVSSTGLYPDGGMRDATLCAGLPHFATHHMRCWGRDIFIALPGLMLATGRFDDAKAHLMAFASCIYHGLIPNLLDAGRRPRFNARDATWFFLFALQSYCKRAPNGYGILTESVSLRFISDEYTGDYGDHRRHGECQRTSKPMHAIISDILQRHLQGISFREWNAGSDLDQQMQDEGFNISIRTDRQTGFIYGGNPFNCGTWMDKMGESHKAGNKGIPATPRDGAAVELIALLYATLKWIVEDASASLLRASLAEDSSFTYSQWLERIRSSFEEHFYYAEGGYYRDTVGATNPSHDLQLRPNYLVAMSLAPSLFDPTNARRALAIAEMHLLGPLGMRTLAPTDSAYHPNYHNGDDSDNWHTAHGFNYHQGPEWLWLTGPYYMACHHFLPSSMNAESLMRRLLPHWQMLTLSPFRGLVELTNLEGAQCDDSCANQAWSNATLLEAILLISQSEVK